MHHSKRASSGYPTVLLFDRTVKHMVWSKFKVQSALDWLARPATKLFVLTIQERNPESLITWAERLTANYYNVLSVCLKCSNHQTVVTVREGRSLCCENRSAYVEE